MGRERILVVDDEAGVRLGIRRFLEAKGYRVQEADSCRGAEDAFRSDPPDAAILDFVLPDGNGIDLVPRLKKLEPSVPILMVTAHGSIELAVRAVKEGADQFLTKPAQLPSLLVMLERLLEERRARRKDLAVTTRQAREGADPFLGESPAIKRLAEEVGKICASESAVLIQGETGTGKGVLARWLHDHGPRAEEAFVDLNCAGLSRDLLESELFGHQAGAFTGASQTKLGMFEVAHRGTVFLDEIGDMDPAVQPRLLKVLEEHRFRRVGDIRDKQVDIRLVAATHQDLTALVRQQRFRSDLYFRVSTIPLTVPPLRQRPEDIPPLARHLLERCGREMGRAGVSVCPEALDALCEYSWPGNIRELRNVLERALLVSDEAAIRTQDLRLAGPGLAVSTPFGREETLVLSDLERSAIEAALAAENGNVECAARRLGISRSALYKKIKRSERR